ncbi:hypothetical protein [Arthrobacter rhombi]|uniref:hypothetical protein n=1 Tax=Arthrobacter rhombi TaxID=71253 RepID=UPI003FD5E450
MEFIRFQSAIPNRRGCYPGVFAMANGLAAQGVLSDDDLAWQRQANSKANALYPDPTIQSPDCYASSSACAWFKASATHLLTMCQEYLALLDEYEIPWVELRSRNPGRITHEDEVQIVVQPFEHPKDWDDLWKQRTTALR